MFQSIGERFNIGTTFLMRRFKKCCRFKDIEVSQTELTILGSLLCAIVLVGGAAAFHYFEDWKFTDAFYFCFITMSTIGFGDYVALQNETVAALQTQPEYVAFCIIYILFGLTVFAAALNLMVLRLLTMNTVDERKDELEALAAARRAPRLDGDVILSNANGLVHSNLNSSSVLVMENASLSMHEMDDLPTPNTKHRKLSPLHRSDSRRVILPQKHESTVQEVEEELPPQPPHPSTDSVDADYSKVIINLTKRKSSNPLANFRMKHKFKFPKLRYTARPKPCASIKHLLPMQGSSSCTPLLQRRIGNRHNSMVSGEITPAPDAKVEDTAPSDDIVIENVSNGSLLTNITASTDSSMPSSKKQLDTISVHHNSIAMTTQSGQCHKHLNTNGHMNQNAMAIASISPLVNGDEPLQKRFSC